MREDNGDEKTVEKEDINSTHLLEFVYNMGADLPRYIASFPVILYQGISCLINPSSKC